MRPGDDERRNAYEVLFRANYGAVQQFLRARYPYADSTEVMSATFEIAWRRFDSIPPDAQRGWLIGVARNCSRNEIRGARRRRANVDALRSAMREDTVAADPITSTHREWLVSAFATLSRQDQEILLLAEWDGLRGNDLAKALGLSKSTAAVRLHRAKIRLRASLLVEEGET